jgi:signal transduction histidine kinase
MVKVTSHASRLEQAAMGGLPFERYAAALGDYLKTQREAALYEASLLSQLFVEQRAGPDEIVALHFESLDKILRGMTYREHTRAVNDAHQFLLEVMIAYGVTYREYLDMKLQEHERDTRAREEILGSIAHELRSPIAAAQVNLDMARRHLAKGRVELIAPRIGTARGALDRLSRLTANLVRSGSMQPFADPHELVDLGAITNQACEWAEASAAEKEIRFVHEPYAGPPILVYGDSDALLSVFGNLLSNAIRYTRAGGQVTVRCGINGGSACITVQDTGIGMTEEVKARIFDKFYRGPEARSVEAQGLGLGLTLVHQAVSAHHGSVSVETDAGQGTTFRVVLPLASAEDNASERRDETG